MAQYPSTLGWTGTSGTPTLDPTQNPTLMQKLLAQMGQTGSAGGTTTPGGAPQTAPIPGVPTQTAGNAGIFGIPSTPTPGSAGAGSGGSSGTASGPNTSGLDPNNPIDAIFLKTGYGDRGIGSGFGDLSYWRQHPDQASRLLADQQGTGSDTPGPGDTGNTSHGTGGGGGGMGTAGPGSLNLQGSDLLQQALGAQGSDPSQTIFARIMQALQAYGGG